MPKLLNTLRNIVLYVVLAKHDNEQSDLLHRVAEERLLEDLPNYQQVEFWYKTIERCAWEQSVPITVYQKKPPNWCNQILGAREVHNKGADQPGHLFRLLWTSPQRRTGGNRSLFKVCFECAFVLFVKESIQNSLSICCSQGRGGRQEVVGLEGQGGGA